MVILRPLLQTVFFCVNVHRKTYKHVQTENQDQLCRKELRDLNLNDDKCCLVVRKGHLIALYSFLWRGSAEGGAVFLSLVSSKRTCGIES